MKYSELENRFKRVERTTEDILNRKLFFIFLPLIRNKLIRDHVLFGAHYLHFKMRAKAFCSQFMVERAFFSFSTLHRLVRYSLLFFYHFIARVPRSCVLLINGIRDDFAVRELFQRSEGHFHCSYLLTWFPGFLSNFNSAKLAYRVRHRLLMLKKSRTLRQFQLMKILKTDADMVRDGAMFWRFPSLVFFLNSSKFYKGAADEANNLRMPSIGLVDVDTMAWMKLPYFIPWNARRVSSIKIFLQLVGETFLRSFLMNLFHQQLGEHILTQNPAAGLPVRSDFEKKMEKMEKGELVAFTDRKFRRSVRTALLFDQQTKLVHRGIAKVKLATLTHFSRYWLAYNRTLVQNNATIVFKRFGKGPFSRLSFLHFFMLNRFIYYNLPHRSHFLKIKPFFRGA